MHRALVVLGLLAAAGVGVALLGRGGDGGRGTPAPDARSQGSGAGQGAATTAPGPRVEGGGAASDGGADLHALGPFQRRGRVLGPDGAGVAGVEVGMLLRPSGLGGPFEDGGRFLDRARTDAAGSFALKAPSAGSFWLSPLVRPQVAEWVGAPLEARFSEQSDTSEVLLRVMPSRAIAGRVDLGARTGLALRDVRVIAIGEQTGQSASAIPAEDGSFLLGSLFDDTYFLSASTPGAVARSVHGVRAGAADVVLTLEPVGALRVLVEGGAPPGLRIECSPADGNPAQLARLAFVGRSPQLLLPGPYEIAAYTQTELGLATVDGIGTSTEPREVTVTLAPAGALDVANLAPSARIVVVELDGRVARAQAIGHTGRTTLPVPPGALTVREHTLDGALVRTHSVTVAAGDRATLQLGG